MTTTSSRSLALIILDGWGYREEKKANAIASAHKPYWDKLWNTNPHTLISGSGQEVGLPDEQMGNSEVGHLNMGAGRIVYQDFTRIDQAILNGDFFTNPTLVSAFTKAKQTQKAVHIMGLLSPGGVHSHERHIHALLKLAAKMELKAVYLHAFLDGRDTPPKSAKESLSSVEQLCKTLSCGQIASIVGRYYAMDRDQRWDRIQRAYDLLVTGCGEYQATDSLEALEQAYQRGESDEFVKPTSIGKQGVSVPINEGDILIFMNFRSDRARELTQAFTDSDFIGFERTKQSLGAFICLGEYDKRFNLPTVFAPQSLDNTLPAYISKQGLRQLHIAETEKYAHVTFFFNGGLEKPYPLEDRILIPSPKVATYDLHPEMSAPALTDRLVQEIKRDYYQVFICNFANADMVGHSGNFDATVKAIETIDHCLERIIETLKAHGGEAIITADHGNAECMFDPITNQAHTAHTSNLVPFLYVGRKAMITTPHGKLSDIAPTMLYLMNLTKPKEMTGIPLVELV